MRRAAWLFAFALAGLGFAMTATAGPGDPTPAPEKTPLITLTAQDFFGQSSSGLGLPGVVPAFHPVTVTNLDGSETWKGQTDETGLVRFNNVSSDFIVTIYCPDGQHAQYQEKHVHVGDTLVPMEMTVRLKPTGPRFLNRTIAVGDAYEPGDNTSAGAVLMNPGDNQAHNFGPGARDTDWTKFYAKFDKVYEVKTFNLQRRADTVVTIYRKTDAGLVQVLQRDDDENGFGSTAIFRATESGYYFVETKPFSADTVPPESGYLLSLRERSRDSGDVADTLGGAMSMSIDSEFVDQQFATSNDRDLFAVVLDPLQTYEFETFGLEGATDTVLRLLDSTGREVYLADDTVPGLASSFPYRVMADGGGTYYLEASNHRGHAGSSFRYGVRAKSHGGLPNADAGPDLKFCDPASRTITLDASRSGNANGPYQVTTGSKPFIPASPIPGSVRNGICDDCATTQPIGFPFSWYNSPKTTVNIASNGFLSFGGGGLGNFTNVPIPTTADPNDALYGMWDDLRGDLGTGIYSVNTIVDGQNALLVAYENVPFFNDNAQNATFNIILFSDGCVEFRYGVGAGALGTGSDSTIGVENASGTVGPQIAYLNPAAGAPGTSYRLCPGPAVVVDCAAGARVVTTTCVFNGAGTTVSGIACDDCGVAVALPFTFPFFGSNKTSGFVTSNGYFAFNNANLGNFTNTAIPNAGTPNDVIYPFWDDLYPASGGTITTRTDGVTPNRQFVVSWNSVPHFAGTGAASFQMKLYETTGQIDFCYGTHTPTGTVFNGTIGIENAAGNSATQISFASSGDNFPANGTAFQFIPAGSAPGLTYEWDTNGDGIFDAMGRTVNVTINPNVGADCAARKRQHVFTLRVTDCATGRRDTDTVTVNNGDFDPPLITPSYLGPAFMYIKNNNHECTLWNVNDLGSATDNCGVSNFGIGGTGCDGCFSTQGIEGGGVGDGNFTPDCCVNDGPCGSDTTRATVKIREERNGGQEEGPDRAYFMNSEARDLCGNSATMLLGVCITHSESPASTSACDLSTALVPACPGTDNHGNKPCAAP